MIGYGLTHPEQVVQMATAVCDAIGHGSNGHGVELLVETAAAETLLGTYKDPHQYGAGVGLTQCDLSTFEWLQSKYGNHRLGRAIEKAFGINLLNVHYVELATSPLLSLLFCRLRYYTVPAPIPPNRKGRATYWKEHYNTLAGKGTASEYLERCAQSGVDTLLMHLK